MAATAHDVPAEVLEQLIVIAAAYDPSDIAEAVLEISCEFAPHFSVPEGQDFDDPTTATGFLKTLITDVRRERKPAGRPTAGNAIDKIKRWFPVEDPLRIAQDPECGYGRPARFMS